ncbi:hypothetical protein [Salinibius halmophilus]|uniref:hypothetical protein n=1 Tax=Salinibius halmophilus TaxID=1853216 RepID=UPI000E67622B|nr:hypothetical protein [Salinibius halmophilus]
MTQVASDQIVVKLRKKVPAWFPTYSQITVFIIMVNAIYFTIILEEGNGGLEGLLMATWWVFMYAIFYFYSGYKSSRLSNLAEEITLHNECISFYYQEKENSLDYKRYTVKVFSFGRLGGMVVLQSSFSEWLGHYGSPLLYAHIRIGFIANFKEVKGFLLENKVI